MLPAPIAWGPGETVRILDQTLLPADERYLDLATVDAVAEAIRALRVRGAPLIGIAAAMGVTLARPNGEGATDFLAACDLLESTRPTAVNLPWAMGRMRERIRTAVARSEPVRPALVAEASAIWDEDRAMCDRIGEAGLSLIPEGATVLTHCNAGALATAGYGTALGVIRSAARRGKVRSVFADETRPYLQGARLTAWELMRDGIPVTVIADNMAGFLMSRGEVNAVVVGADRIARNGDVANKIGTYSVAVLARENGIPFYVAAPVSTFDLATPSGKEIPIEERPAEEVTHHGGRRLTPEGVAVRNPAFDVTPARYVTAIVCERGVARPPYEESLAALSRCAS